MGGSGPWYEVALVSAIATFSGFLVDMARRWLMRQMQFRDDLRRKEAGLPLIED